MNNYVEVKNLSKSFGRTRALQNINLEIKNGSIVGLLGSNGAGKTTLLRTLVGINLPDEGTCMTWGCPSHKLSEKEFVHIGYVDQESELMGWMKGHQLVRFIASHYPHWNQEIERKLIERMNIDLSKKIQNMSPGEVQTLSILCAVCFEPELLILDEPASGLDPIVRAELMQFLTELIQDEERTIVISSHILTDIEKVADQIMIIKEGRLIRQSGLDELKQAYSKIKVQNLRGDLSVKSYFKNYTELSKTNNFSLGIVEGQSDREIMEIAKKNGLSVEISKLSLEDIYRLEVSKA